MTIAVLAIALFAVLIATDKVQLGDVDPPPVQEDEVIEDDEPS